MFFDKDQYINEEIKKANVRREDFDRWVNILKEEYERENGWLTLFLYNTRRL